MVVLSVLLGVLVGFLCSEWVLWSALEKPFFRGLGGFQYVQAGAVTDSKELHWWERLPMISLRLLWSGGKLQKSVVWFGLAFQLLMGFFFAANWLWIGSLDQYWFWQVMAVLLLLSAFYDLAYQMIPELLLWILVAFVLLFSGLYSVPLNLGAAILGGAVVGGLVLAMYLLTKGKGIGGADIYVSAVVGMLYGWSEGLLVFALGNMVGLLVILPMLVTHGKKKVKQVPLVFFLVIAIYLEFFLLITDQVFGWLSL